MLELVRRARLRLLYNELLSQGANAASAALLAFILLLLLGTQILNWQWTVPIPLAAFAIGVYFARKRLPSLYRTAQVVDARAQLSDSLSTAYYFSQENPSANVSSEIRTLQAESADRAAAQVDLRAAVPYSMPRAAYVVAALVVVASSLFALRYGLTRRLDLQQPLASMLQESFGFQPRVEQARNNRRMKQPEPETQPSDDGSAADQQDNKQADQQDADSANAEAQGESQKPSGEQKASSPDGKQQGEDGEKADSKDGQGDENSGSEGEDNETTKSADGKSDPNKDGQSKQDSSNSGENSSLLSKVKDFAQNLLSRVKPQQGQNGNQQQQSSGDQKSNASKGQQNSGKQSKDGQQQNGGQQGDAQEGQAGEQAQNSQDQQGKGTGKSDSQQTKQPGSGIGSQDGDKSLKQAADMAAMGKISEIFGKRSATISGESTVEVQQTAQQLHTPYAQKGSQHAQGGTEIRRDEIPVSLEGYVQQYFEQVHKQAPAAGTAPAPAKKQN